MCAAVPRDGLVYQYMTIKVFASAMKSIYPLESRLDDQR
jgi:hypothetical protein